MVRKVTICRARDPIEAAYLPLRVSPTSTRVALSDHHDKNTTNTLTHSIVRGQLPSPSSCGSHFHFTIHASTGTVLPSLSEKNLGFTSSRHLTDMQDGTDWFGRFIGARIPRDPHWQSSRMATHSFVCNDRHKTVLLFFGGWDSR